MMETLRSWATCVALSALAGGILWLLSPKGSVQKALQAVVAVFLLCAFLSPLFHREGAVLEWFAPEIEEIPDNPQLAQTLLEQQRRAVEEALKKQCGDILVARGIEGAEISVQTDILDDGSIEIVSVQVKLPGGVANIDALRTALREVTGLAVEIRTGA